MKYLEKIIEYGLYLLVFLLPIQTRWIIKAGELNGGSWEYGTYSLYATDIILIIVLILFIAYKFFIRNRKSDFKTSSGFWWFIYGLLIMSTISVFFAVSKLLALYKLGWLILGIGLFWLIVSANYDRLKLIYTILASIFLQAILGIWQFLIQSSFVSKWLGIALHNGADLGTSVIETVGTDGIGERWLRAYGGLDHPNMLGAVMAVGILLILYLILVGKPSEKPSVFRMAPLLKGLIIIFCATLFFSFSRAAWLGLAVGLVVLLASTVIKKDRLAQQNILQVILIIGTIFFILFFQYSNLVMTRLSAGERLEIKSTTERVESIKNSWPIIKSNWLTGVGLGNYTLTLNRQTPSHESFYYQPTHNVFLLIWAEIGLVGLILFIGLIIFVFVKLLCHYEYRIYHNNSTILIMLIFIMMFDHWFWSLHFGVLFFWLVLGIVAKKKSKKLLSE